MSKKVKLLIYVQVHEIDGKIDFKMIPNGSLTLENDQHVFELGHDPKTTSRIKIHLLSNTGQQSFLEIKKVVLNGETLNNLDIWAKYIPTSDSPRSTYGYMNQPGVYVLNVHQNSLVHNYMSYFLSRCTN